MSHTPVSLHGKTVSTGLIGLAVLASQGLLPDRASAAPGAGYDLKASKKLIVAEADIFPSSPIGPSSVAACDITLNGSTQRFVGFGSGAGTSPALQQVTYANRSATDPFQNWTLNPVDTSNFSSGATTGLRIAAGDCDGDGSVDVLGCAASGVSGRFKLVAVKTISWSYDDAYSYPQDHGLYIAVGDVLRPAGSPPGRRDEIITAPTAIDPNAGTNGTPGGPVIKLFSENLTDPQHPTADLLQSIRPWSAAVPARVSTGDVDGDGIPDLICAPESGGGPHVQVFHGGGTSLTNTLGTFPDVADASQPNGVYVTAADVNGDGIDEIIVSPGPGGGPNIRIYDYIPTTSSYLLFDTLTPFGASYNGGMTVAVGDFDGDGTPNLIVSAIAPVPEPASLAAVPAALLLLRRRRVARG